MKRTKRILAALVLACALSAPAAQAPAASKLTETEFEAAASKMVYICTGPNAKVYQISSRCRGLQKCSGSIKKVTLEDARKMKRRACKICA